MPAASCVPKKIAAVCKFLSDPDTLNREKIIRSGSPQGGRGGTVSVDFF